MRPSCSSPNFSSSSSETESDSVLTVRRGRIAKIAKERRERRETMAKLQRMIPSSKDCKSQLELLQRVIDYIFILQVCCINFILIKKSEKNFFFFFEEKTVFLYMYKFYF